MACRRAVCTWRSRLRLLAILAVAWLATFSQTARAQARDDLTQEDHEGLAALSQANSANADVLRRAQLAFARASWAEAAELYGSLPDSDEASRLPLRRRCQALTALGRREEALATGQRLLRLVVPNAADLQATVGALMLGDGRPSDADLMAAQQMARRAEGIDPEGVWGHAARCAIAERLGDRAALAACGARLRQLAPEHFLAKRFGDAARSEPSRALQLFLLAALGLGTLLTLAHALMARRRVATGAMLAALVMACPLPAFAQAFGIVEEPATGAPYSGPPSEQQHAAESEVLAFKEEAKRLQELTDKIASAEAAILERHDWQAGVGLYIEVVELAPYCGKCWRRLCEGFGYLAEPVEGAHACRQAIASPDNNAWDRAMLVHHLLSGKSEAQPEVRAEARRNAEEAVTLAPGERWGYDARCQLALRENDLARLGACAKKLAELAPDDRKSLSLSFVVALGERRFDAAEALIDRGAKEGLDRASVQVMREQLRAKAPGLWRMLPGLVAVLLAVAAFIVLRLLSKLRTRKTNLAAGEPV
jgi:hypothetical protein